MILPRDQIIVKQTYKWTAHSEHHPDPLTILTINPNVLNPAKDKCLEILDDYGTPYLSSYAMYQGIMYRVRCVFEPINNLEKHYPLLLSSTLTSTSFVTMGDDMANILVSSVPQPEEIL